MNHEPRHEPIPFIRELCRDCTEEEILEAEERFREYLRIVKDICDQEGAGTETLDSEESTELLSGDSRYQPIP